MGLAHRRAIMHAGGTIRWYARSSSPATCIAATGCSSSRKARPTTGREREAKTLLAPAAVPKPVPREDEYPERSDSRRPRRHPEPSSRSYSPECVEQVFSEVLVPISRLNKPPLQRYAVVLDLGLIACLAPSWRVLRYPSRPSERRRSRGGPTALTTTVGYKKEGRGFRPRPSS